MTTPPTPEPDPAPRVRPRREPLDPVERLVSANAESNATMRNLVERVREDAHMRERKIDLLEDGLHQTRRLLLMVGVVLVIVLGIGIINAINITQGRRNAEATAQVARDAQATYALLLGCLDTTSPCGRSNSEKTKEALDRIKQYELIVIYCARSNPRDKDEDGSAFIACVARMFPGGPSLPATR